MTPLRASHEMWSLWFLSWMIAAIWSRRVAARPPALEQFVHWIPTLAGFGLLAQGAFGWQGTWPPDDRLWPLSDSAGWALAGVCAAGFLFTWWARISLGSLWSGTVSRKADHRVIQSGPYRLVRHPIYTGLIVAAVASALLIGRPANLAGAALIAFGFWLKASMEERFLSQELGADAYADYRRRTPMLVPFWPTRG
jgi:protein-S-isoprenylcysteine O-methyltransferase Ste14